MTPRFGVVNARHFRVGAAARMSRGQASGAGWPIARRGEVEEFRGLFCGSYL